MTFKAMILLSRREDMTVEQFRTWWVGEHTPLAHQLPGLRRSTFNVCEANDDGVDGITELWFDTKADFEAAYATEIGKAVAADSLAHVRRRTRVMVAEEHASS